MATNEDKKVGTTLLLMFTPVVVIAITILLGVFFVIGMTILGWDRGSILTSMGKVEYARGLITYLFAVVTIGTAVVLCVSALTQDVDPDSEKKFQRGKEVFSLLLGVFGTIVGYYFGSEKSAPPDLRVIAPVVQPMTVKMGDTRATITSAVTGGTPPYTYKLEVGGTTVAEHQRVREGGLIIHDFDPSSIKTAGGVTVRISAVDSTSRTTSAESRLEITK
jgi:hypothetical protein